MLVFSSRSRPPLDPFDVRERKKKPVMQKGYNCIPDPDMTSDGIPPVSGRARNA